MKANEIENLENLKKITARYFHTLKPNNDKPETNSIEIKFLNYCELGRVITDLLKLCIVALDHDVHKIPESNRNQAINVGLVLETVLQMIPLDEFEFLSEISYMLIKDAKNGNE